MGGGSSEIILLRRIGKRKGFISGAGRAAVSTRPAKRVRRDPLRTAAAAIFTPAAAASLLLVVHDGPDSIGSDFDTSHTGDVHVAPGQVPLREAGGEYGAGFRGDRGYPRGMDKDISFSSVAVGDRFFHFLYGHGGKWAENLDMQVTFTKVT